MVTHVLWGRACYWWCWMEEFVCRSWVHVCFYVCMCCMFTMWIWAVACVRMEKQSVSHSLYLNYFIRAAVIRKMSVEKRMLSDWHKPCRWTERRPMLTAACNCGCFVSQSTLTKNVVRRAGRTVQKAYYLFTLFVVLIRLDIVEIRKKERTIKSLFGAP